MGEAGVPFSTTRSARYGAPVTCPFLLWPGPWGGGSGSLTLVARGLKAVAARSMLTCLSIALALPQSVQGP